MITESIQGSSADCDLEIKKVQESLDAHNLKMQSDEAYCVEHEDGVTVKVYTELIAAWESMKEWRSSRGF